MTTLVEGRHNGEFVVSEANGHRPRENITTAASQTLAAGSVLGKVTATGHYVVLAPAASDGSEGAAAILLNPVTTGAGETKKVAAFVRDCEVNASELTWPGGITTNQRTAAIGQLAALGILARPAV